MTNTHCEGAKISVTAEKSHTPNVAVRTATPHIVLHEDERARLIWYVIKPGEQTGWHTHEYDYAVVRLSKGTLTSHFADGTSTRIRLRARHDDEL